MKIIIIIITIIIISFGLVSCEKNIDVTESSSKPGVSEGNTSALSITIPKRRSTVEYSHYDDWVDIMKEKFNIDIKIKYIPLTDYAAYTYGNLIIDSIDAGTMTGLIRLMDDQINRIIELKEAGSILPFDEYLKDNKNINLLPVEMFSGYKIDNKLWAIPGGYCNLPSIRIIRNSFLEEANMKVPETLDELFNTLVEFKKLGKDPLIINSAALNSYALNLKDMFYANGNYISYSGESSISYNPNTNSYEDFMFSDEAANSLKYINLLLQNNIIYKKSATYFDDFLKDNKNGSFYQETYKNNFSDEFSIIWGLSGSNSSFLNPSLTSYYAFVMSKNTVDPSKTANDFINTFLVDQEGYLLANIGIEKVTYYKNDNSDVVLVTGEKRIDITHFNTIHLANGTTKYLSDSGEEVYKGFTEMSPIIQELLDKDKLFAYTYDMFNNVQDSGLDTSFGFVFKSFIDSNGKANVDEFIEEYRKNAKIAGVADVIKAINEKFNTTSVLKY